MQSQQPTKKGIVVIGLGPTGLAATLEASKNDSKKRRVYAITERAPTEYNRDIIFRLDEDTLPYLEQLVGSPRVEAYKAKDLIGPRQIAADNRPYHTIRIGALEQLLYSALEDEKNVEIITTPKHQAHKITSIDKCKQTYTLSHTEPSIAINFEHLVAADGYHHGTADLIPAHGIEYHCTQQTVRFTKHARVNYKVPPDSSTRAYDTFLEQVPDKKPTLKELYKLGWSHYSHPEARLFVNDGIFYIGAECPNTFDANTPAKEIDQWLRTVLRFHLPEAAIGALITTECAVFEVSLREANCTLSFCSPKKQAPCTETDFAEAALFLQLGDALRAPHYQTGSGAVVGLQQAAAYGEFLKSAQKVEDLNKYHAKIAEIRAVNRIRVDTFLEKRAAREVKAHKDLLGSVPSVKPNMNMFDHLRNSLIEIFGYRQNAITDSTTSIVSQHPTMTGSAIEATTSALGFEPIVRSETSSAGTPSLQQRSQMQFFHFNIKNSPASEASNPTVADTKKTKVTARTLYLQTKTSTATASADNSATNKLTYKYL